MKPPPPLATTSVSKSPDLLLELAGHRALPGHGRGMVVRVDHHRPGLGLADLDLALGIVVVAVDHGDGGAEALDVGALDRRRRRRHEDLDAQSRAAEPTYASAAPWLPPLAAISPAAGTSGSLQHAVEGAARLERSGVLQQLELERDAVVLDHRRPAHDAGRSVPPPARSSSGVTTGDSSAVGMPPASAAPARTLPPDRVGRRPRDPTPDGPRQRGATPRSDRRRDESGCTPRSVPARPMPARAMHRPGLAPASEPFHEIVDERQHLNRHRERAGRGSATTPSRRPSNRRARRRMPHSVASQLVSFDQAHHQRWQPRRPRSSEPLPVRRDRVLAAQQQCTGHPVGQLDAGRSRHPSAGG